MSSLKFDLPQLDYTTRFALWQVKMRAILAQSSDLDEAIDAFGEKAKDTWTDAEKRKDRKALSLIQLHLSNNILQEVLQEKTTAELWVKLEEICLSKDLTGRLHVKMKLFSHKLQEGGSIMNHLSSWKEIVSDLQSIEVKYEDEDLGLLLLCSLPNSFSNFRDTILLSRDKLTLAEVYDALQQKEKMKSMVQAESSSSKAEALEVRGRPEQRDNYYHNNRDKSKGDRGRSKSKGRDKFCRYCKKSSHNIDDCWKLQNKEKRNGTYQPKNNDGNGMAAVVTGKGEAAVVAGNDGSDSSDGDCLAVLAACVSRDDEWILDVDTSPTLFGQYSRNWTESTPRSYFSGSIRTPKKSRRRAGGPREGGPRARPYEEPPLSALRRLFAYLTPFDLKTPYHLTKLRKTPGAATIAKLQFGDKSLSRHLRDGKCPEAISINATASIMLRE
ncbi:hypothetical protein QYE76_028496 [Lolium multiflorum]|uniref:Uncharacterized protein n=1 Tax=Lolium multiflorum TaxID=4521 RepID=A0AAD8QL41_LOLMU|nr:hypothetical protein QYE76_028496 [Lolium multiflorum]